jgi:hypothetical protein
MFHVDYYLNNGEQIQYMCPGDWPSVEDTNKIALEVAQRRPNSIPDTVFVNVRLYSYWISNFGMQHYGMASIAADGGLQYLQVWTAVGPLKVVVKPWACDAKLFLVGTDDDFERYDLDKVFEEVVLKDCERE